jgi:hypothetical protein
MRWGVVRNYLGSCLFIAAVSFDLQEFLIFLSQQYKYLPY